MTVPPGTPLLNASFLLYLLGLGATALADAVLFVALPFAVLARGGTPAELAGVVLCASLPRFAAVLLGALADRLPARRVLLFSALLRALLVLGIGWAALHGWAGAGLFGAFALLNGLLVTLTVATSSVVVPRLVPAAGLAPGNSLAGAASRALPLIGYGLGGLLVKWLGSGETLLLAAPLYLLMVLAAALLRAAEASAARRERLSLLGELAEGWRVRRGNPLLMFMLVLTFALSFSLNLLNVRAPLFSLASGWGAGGYALIEALFSGAALLGIAGAALLGQRLSLRAQVSASLLVFTAGMLAHAVPQLGVWFVGSALAGLGIGALDVASLTLLQMLVPDGLRGRLTGSSISSGALGLSLGALVAGQRWSTTALMLGLGLVLALLSLGWLWQSRQAKASASPV